MGNVTPISSMGCFKMPSSVSTILPAGAADLRDHQEMSVGIAGPSGPRQADYQNLRHSRRVQILIPDFKVPEAYPLGLSVRHYLSG